MANVTNETLAILEDEVRGGRQDQLIALLSRCDGLGASEISEILEYLQAEGWDMDDEYLRRCQVRCALNEMANENLAHHGDRRHYALPTGGRASEYLWHLR